MTIAVALLERAFRYQSLTLPDPGADKTPDQVRQIYAGQYPELATAVVEGPVTKGKVSTYTFTRAVGSKGASHARRLRRVAEGKDAPDQGDVIGRATASDLEENRKCSTTVKAVLGNSKASTSLVPPQAAYSMFG